MPFSRVFFPIHNQHASAFSFAVHPLSFELFVLPCYELSMSVFTIVVVPPLVCRTVLPTVNTKTVFLTLKKTSFVTLPIFVPHHPSSRCQFVIRKVPLVLPFITTFVHPFTMFFACYVLSLVRGHIARFNPVLLSFSIR